MHDIECLLFIIAHTNLCLLVCIGALHACIRVPSTKYRMSPWRRQDLASAWIFVRLNLALAATDLSSVGAGSKSRGRPHAGNCHIPRNATCCKLPHPGKSHIQENAKCWTMSHPGNCHILDPPSVAANATSWRRPDPGKCPFPDLFRWRGAQMRGKVKSWETTHAGDCQILWEAKFRRLSHPGKCHIPEHATSLKLPHPDLCHILETATSRKMPHPRNGHIPNIATSRQLLDPGTCHIQEHATSRAMPHPENGPIWDPPPLARDPQAGEC